MKVKNRSVTTYGYGSTGLGIARSDGDMGASAGGFGEGTVAGAEMTYAGGGVAGRAMVGDKLGADCCACCLCEALYLRCIKVAIVVKSKTIAREEIQTLKDSSVRLGVPAISCA